MRLKTFQIMNGFGFSDSGAVDLDPAGGITFVLGRNSSGKTSLLQAIRHLELGLIPQGYKNFNNFNPGSPGSWLVANFSVEKGDLDHGRFLSAIEQRLLAAGVPKIVMEENPEVKKLLSIVGSEYGELIEHVSSLGVVRVEKASNGNYSFLPTFDRAKLNQRKKILSSEWLRVFPENKIRHNKVESQISVGAQAIEDEFFREFPPIVFFGEAYRLGDDISERIVQDNLNSPKNEVEKAFVEFLGVKAVARFLAANDPDERDELLFQLREKVRQVCLRINQQSTLLRQPADLIDIILHEKDGLQVTVKVDGKKSFYRHLSDTTKVLIAYHLHELADNIAGGVILFDEPSTGFHPSAQGYLLDFMRSVALSGAQVVMSTHSEYMIDLNSLHAVRIMKADPAGMLLVDHHPYKPARSKGDLLSLQPILDAIGLRYGLGVTLARSMVLVEGITDLIYLRAMNKILGVAGELSIAPARGDSNIMTLIPFLIGQGIGFKLMIDAGGLRQKIQGAYGIGDEFIFEVQVPEKFRDKIKSSGVEDLFSRDDFRKLAAYAGVDLGDARKAEYQPNSVLVKNNPGKALIAHALLERAGREGIDFEEETILRFRQAIEFCAASTGFLL